MTDKRSRNEPPAIVNNHIHLGRIRLEKQELRLRRKGRSCNIQGSYADHITSTNGSQYKHLMASSIVQKDTWLVVVGRSAAIRILSFSTRYDRDCSNSISPVVVDVKQ